MLGRLILILIQVAVAWFVTPKVIDLLPRFGGELAIFVTAAVMAILVWLTGFIGSVVLKDVAQPSPATLTFTLIGALIGAGLTLVPGVTEAVASVVRGVPRNAYPLAGAVIGYAIKK